jgi:hypothetical protein
VAPRSSFSEDVDHLYAELLRLGQDAAAIEALLTERPLPDEVLLNVLRRTVPRPFLELLARTEPWAGRPAVLTAVVTSPRAERSLCLRLLPHLPWHSLAVVAATPWLLPIVRLRAEGMLVEQLPELKLGERIALARLATRALLARLVDDLDSKVVEASLLNPRLTTDDLVLAIGRDTASRCLLEACASCARWRETYTVRLGLVLQPRTPLPIALAQISSLTRRDLLRVSRAPTLAPLVCRAAEHVLAVRAGGQGAAPLRKPGTVSNPEN